MCHFRFVWQLNWRRTLANIWLDGRVLKDGMVGQNKYGNANT